MLPTSPPAISAGRVPSAFRNPAFLLLWIAQAISQTAQNAVFFALLVYVEQRTSSSFQLGILVLSTILPFAFFGIGAGVLVDRWPKKHVLAISNLVRVPISLLYLVFIEQSLAAVYALNLVFTTVSQFFAPAEAAAIPLVVRREQLLQANGLFNLMLVISQLLGYVVLGPPLVKLFGPAVLFVTIAVAYAVATVLIIFVPIREQLADRPKEFRGTELIQNIFSEMRAGLRLVRSDAGIALSVTELTVFQNITLATGVIAPGFVSRVLNISPEDAVYVLAPAGIGILLGAVAVPRWATRVSKDRMILTGLLIVGGMFLLLAALPTIYGWVSELFYGRVNPTNPVYLRGLIGLVMVVTHIMGWGFSMVVVTAQTVLQMRSPEHMRARVFAFQYTFANVVSILPLLFLGILADIIGITRVIALIGLTVLATWYFAQTRSHEADSLQPVSKPPAA